MTEKLVGFLDRGNVELQLGAAASLSNIFRRRGPSLPPRLLAMVLGRLSGMMQSPSWYACHAPSRTGVQGAFALSLLT